MNDFPAHDAEAGTPAAAPAPALAVGEETTSSDPKIQLGNSKAVVATIGGVVTAISVWLTTGPLTDGALDLNEGIALVIAILGGLGFGVGTYVVPTKVTGVSGK
jgi:hypothetical protein